jgi:hypothetical protein
MSPFGLVAVNLQLMAEEFEESAFTITEGRVTEKIRNTTTNTNVEPLRLIVNVINLKKNKRLA